METENKAKTARDCVNETLYWLEGLVDGTAVTREECLALLAQAITSLQGAYTYLMFE